MKLLFINLFFFATFSYGALRQNSNATSPNGGLIVDELFDYIVVGAGGAGIPFADYASKKGKKVLLVERGLSRAHTKYSLDIQHAGLVIDTPQISQPIYTKDGVISHIGTGLGGGTAINMGIVIEEQKSFWRFLMEKFDFHIDLDKLYDSYKYVINKVGSKSNQPYGISNSLRAGFHNISADSTTEYSEFYSKRRLNGTWKVYSIFNHTDDDFRYASDALLGSKEDIINDHSLERPFLKILTNTTVDKIQFDKGNSRQHNLHAKCIIYHETTQKDIAPIGLHENSNERNNILTNLFTSNASGVSELQKLAAWFGDINPAQTIIKKRACIRHSGEIVLAAGAVQTPLLLYRSGIGPRIYLSNLKVQSLLNIEELGTTIYDRVLVPITIFLKEDFHVNPFINPLMASFQLSLETSCGYNCKIVNIESLGGGRIVEGVIYATKLLFPPKYRNHPVVNEIMKVLKYCGQNDASLSPKCVLLRPALSCLRRSMALFYFSAEPKSKGKIHVSKDGKISISANYLQHEQDKMDANNSLRSIIQMVRSGAFDGIAEKGGHSSCPLYIANCLLQLIFDLEEEFSTLWNPMEVKIIKDIVMEPFADFDSENDCDASNTSPLSIQCFSKFKHEKIATFPPKLPNIDDEEELLEFSKTLMTSIWHWSGSAPLGTTVDAHNFILKGTKNVAIVDSSLFGKIPRINPMISVMALGRYAAKRKMKRQKEE